VGGGLRIALLSYPWTHPKHPDKFGFTLRLVAGVLRHYAAWETRENRPTTWGLFWDFGSLYQNPPDGGERSAAEESLFRQGLEGLASLYAHQHTTVFRLTKMPDDYPEAYNLPSNANCAPYKGRGWCFTESCWSRLTKDFDFSLDLGRLTGSEADKSDIINTCTDSTQDGGRKPPLLPVQFAEEVKGKSFTNGRDDKPLVARLYALAFDKQFGQARRLAYNFLGWGDAEAQQLCKLMASGALCSVEELFLYDNKIKDEGMAALAAVLRQHPQAMAALRTFDLRGNPGNDAPVKEALNEMLSAHSHARGKRN